MNEWINPLEPSTYPLSSPPFPTVPFWKSIKDLSISNTVESRIWNIVGILWNVLFWSPRLQEYTHHTVLYRYSILHWVTLTVFCLYSFITLILSPAKQCNDVNRRGCKSWNRTTARILCGLVHWMHTKHRTGISERYMTDHFSRNFQLIPPSGKILQYSSLMESLRKAHGIHGKGNFEIEIKNCQRIGSPNDDAAVAILPLPTKNGSILLLLLLLLLRKTKTLLLLQLRLGSLRYFLRSTPRTTKTRHHRGWNGHMFTKHGCQIHIVTDMGTGEGPILHGWFCRETQKVPLGGNITCLFWSLLCHLCPCPAGFLSLDWDEVGWWMIAGERLDLLHNWTDLGSTNALKKHILIHSVRNLWTTASYCQITYDIAVKLAIYHCIRIGVTDRNKMCMSVQ